MKSIRAFQRSVLLILLLAILAIGYASFVAINNIVAEQSRIQQESMAPVFSLVIDELIKPLHISQSMAEDNILSELLNTSDIDTSALTLYLKRLEETFGLTFFVASEKAMRQFNSDGHSFPLEEDKVEWYFRIRDSGKNFVSDLGNKEKVHLYIDVRLHTLEGEFLGFVGVGKSLESFWLEFQKHKETYGYDLLFVNQKGEIILSTRKSLMGYRESIVTLEDLPWMRELFDSQPSTHNLNSELITIDDEDFLVSEMNIPELGWKLFLLSPLQARQAEISRTFIFNMALVLLLILIVFSMIHFLLKYMARNLEKGMHLDHLTGLANRTKVQHGFEQIKRSNTSLSVLMVDIDHFKSINDTYGHNVGDAVIRKVADIIKHAVRENDVVGRWGGEEFIMLLPGATIELSEFIAEYIRKELEHTTFEVNNNEVSITASFGITFARNYSDLKSIVAIADKALYQAKQEGRNKVCHIPKEE